MGKLLLNLICGNPFSLVEYLAYFDHPIELDILVAGSLDLFVHNVINGALFHAFMVELYRFQLLWYLRCVQQWWKVWVKEVHIEYWV